MESTSKQGNSVMTIQWQLRADKIAVLRLNRPQVLNALSFEILQQFGQAVTEISQSAARGLVVVGAGDKAFCAGADIPELMDRALMQQLEGAALGQQVFRALDELKIPSVAVIQGYAFGGGLELALACTFRVATTRAKMGLPEVKLGLIPGYGGTQRLPRLIGEGHALDMILSGRTVAAEEALQLGLVNRLVDADSPEEAGCAFLAPIVQHSSLATFFARQAVQRGMQTSLERGLEIERDLSTLAYQTADAREGMVAFTEKRPAQFQDK
jgi:enoyl-CoA hydratase